MKTAINHVKIFDGKHILADQDAILFDETGILGIGKGPFEADHVIDGTGKTLTPGLIDGHVHLGLTTLNTSGTEADRISCGAMIAAQAQLVWKYGITTVCNCGTDSNVDIAVRNLIREKQIPGARIVASGMGISITGGHGWRMNHQCDDDLSTLTAARTQIREGADLIKLFATGGMATKGSIPNAPQLEESQMRVAVEAAKAVGALTRAHATGLEGAQRAARAGVRIIDHTQLDAPTAQLLAEHGAYYCPTIVTRYNILHTEDPKYQYMRAKANPGDLDRKKIALELCKKYGITILAGTDSAHGGLTPIGKSLWTELHIYQEFGMTPEEILCAATADAAKALGLEQQTGSLTPGLCADLALFDRDPTADIGNLTRLSMTFQGGEPVYVNPDIR